MIMFALVWWCYPIVMACVAVPMAFFWLIENRRDAREAREDGPFPCLAYLGRDVELGELWCWLIHGHSGEHESQFGLDDDTAFTREWPEESVDVTTYADEEDVILPPLPQRLSKVPAQTEHNDSGIPLCPVDDCGRWKGHGGTHW